MPRGKIKTEVTQQSPLSFQTVAKERKKKKESVLGNRDASVIKIALVVVG